MNNIGWRPFVLVRSVDGLVAEYAENYGEAVAAKWRLQSQGVQVGIVERRRRFRGSRLETQGCLQLEVTS